MRRDDVRRGQLVLTASLTRTIKTMRISWSGGDDRVKDRRYRLRADDIATKVFDDKVVRRMIESFGVGGVDGR